MRPEESYTLPQAGILAQYLSRVGASGGICARSQADEARPNTAG